MFKIAIIKLLVLVTLIIGTSVPSFAAQPTLYSNEEQAQQHCPGDVVVWLNLPTDIYHWKGMRWYGNTKTVLTFVKKKQMTTAIAAHSTDSENT